MDNQRNFPQGNLDMLIRNAASLGPLDGYDGSRMAHVITAILRTTSEGV
jgi:hypothetical protein